MNEADLKKLLLKLDRGLNTLKEREAKFGGNAPLELLNGIDDHETAIGLVNSRLKGDISSEELEEQLASLNVDWRPKFITIDKAQIKFGALAIPTIPSLVLLVVVVSVLIFLGWNFLGPTKMSGIFNVAIAEFGQIDEAQGVQPSQVGKRLSEWVFDTLQATNESYPATKQIDIWQDSLPLTQKLGTIGLVSGTTPEERAEAASILAQNIAADMIIYGNLAPGENTASFVLEFYIAPRLRGETYTTIGHYQFGEPIQLPLNFDLDDPLSRETVTSLLATRTQALFELILGIKEARLGRSEEAVKIFQQAEEQLTAWRDKGEGKDTLYFFMGQSELFLNDDMAAQDYFEKALASNPKQARAQIALNSVYYKRAECRLLDATGQINENYEALCQRQRDGTPIAPCQSARITPEACSRMVDEDLERAIDNAQKGLALVQANHEPHLEIIAQLALGLAYRLQGQISYSRGQDIEANQAFEQAMPELQAVLEPLAEADEYRLLGQTHQALGTVYFQQARILQDQQDFAGSKSLYEQAQTTFEQCIRQAEQAPYRDEIIIEKIIPGCQTFNDITKEALLTLQGAQQ